MLIGFDDGIKRTTKAMGNPQQNIVLVNEVVVARVARAINAPCPNGQAVYLEQPILDNAKREIPELGPAVAGPAFGSEWVEGSYGPSEVILSNAGNRSALAGLMVLYTWTRNTDTKPGHLLWRVLESGTTEVLGFDHGHCFGYQWDESKLANFASAPLLCPLAILRNAVRREDIQSSLNCVNALPCEVFEDAVAQVPQEWSMSSQALQALAHYLDQSRPVVTRIVRAGFGL